MLKNFELQSSKRNAQLLVQILQDPAKEEEVSVPSTFGDADLDNMTDEQIKALVEKEVPQQVVSLDRLNAAQAQAQVMVPGVRAEILDSKRPNPNVQAFLDYLTLHSFTPWGIPEMWASGKPSGADYKANQLFAERAFREQQKSLEQFLDWTFARWHDWSVSRGDISPIADDVRESIAWEWPTQSALDEVAHNQAIRSGLENLTVSYEDILGNGYKEKLLKIKDELAFCREAGIPHPVYKLLSGGESAMIETPTA